jgi:hypothetical protein
MALGYRSLVKPCPLKLPVYVAGEHRILARHGLAPAPQNPETGMRLSGTVQIETMPVEAPGTLRLRLKGFRTGYAMEVNLLTSKHRVSLPESFCAPEVRQSRVNAHPGTSGHYQRVGL